MDVKLVETKVACLVVRLAASRVERMAVLSDSQLERNLVDDLAVSMVELKAVQKAALLASSRVESWDMR